MRHHRVLVESIEILVGQGGEATALQGVVLGVAHNPLDLKPLRWAS